MQLKNKYLTLQICEHGAELTSIVKGDREYLWQAHPAFWKRHSPVLFPIVGSVWEGEYRVNQQVYRLSQHGFARDMDFDLVEHTYDQVTMKLSSTEETKKVYPFSFELKISYLLVDNRIKVIWRVRNTGKVDMPFQIGAHPAFYWPEATSLNDDRTMAEGLLAHFRFFQDGKPLREITSRTIVEKGCVDPCLIRKIALSENGQLPLTFDLFNQDALILENAQTNQIDMLTPQGDSYLSMLFDAPLVGLWTPPAKNAPFVCIEPWYGRCDEVSYRGEFHDKHPVNVLLPGAMQQMEYTIIVH